MKSTQRGISFIGFIMILALAGFFAYLGMRLFPVYAEYYSVKADMQAIADEPGSKGKTQGQVVEALSRRFYISYVESVDLKKNVKLTKVGANNQLNINYEVRKPLMGNLDFVAKFDHTVEMKN